MAKRTKTAKVEAYKVRVPQAKLPAEMTEAELQDALNHGWVERVMVSVPVQEQPDETDEDSNG